MIDESAIPTLADPQADGIVRKIVRELNSTQSYEYRNRIDRELARLAQRIDDIAKTVDGFTDPAAVKIRDARAETAVRMSQVKAHWVRVGIWSAYAFGGAVAAPLALAILAYAWHIFIKILLG